ncbi:MAG: 50S ribosomal protein L18 [bacterium]|nr:50S ribosomal protein L18 [bacterium]
MENKLKRDRKVRHSVRKFRARKRIKGTEERPRLVLFKSLKYLYAQVVNDSVGHTICGTSTLKSTAKNAKNIDSAVELGTIVGVLLKDKGISKVVFDRNGCLYHGKIKAFADSVRAEGINF